MYDSKYHLNTIHIRPQQRMQQLPYQQLKSQLSRQNYFNPQYVQKNLLNSTTNLHNNQQQLQDTMSQLKKLMIDQSSDISSIDKKKLANIHSIKLYPMVNQNFISSFDQHQYKLQPQDKVKIVKQKVFRVQNYYNYLYQLKCKQQHQRKNKQIQNYLKLAKDNRDSIIQEIPTNKLIRQKSLHEINSNRQSKRRVQQKSSLQQRQQQMRFLDPAYTKYEQNRRRENQGYFLKQKDRKRVQQSVVKLNKRSGYDDDYDNRW